MDNSIPSLADTLEGTTCPRCGAPRRRPQVFNNHGLDKIDIIFAKCGAGCGWTVRVPLPRLRKTLIYLDTSIVSHIARAVQRDAPDDNQWIRLLRCLQSASAAEVVECPLSPFVDQEVMLGPEGRHHAWQARGLSVGHLVEPEAVWYGQLLREWRAFLKSEAISPVQETDAFSESPHRWQESMTIKLGPMSSRWLRRRSRKAKQGGHSIYVRVAEDYRQAGLSFDKIVLRESKCYANYIAGRADFVQPLIVEAMQSTGTAPEQAAQRLREFLDSDRFGGLPFVKIHSRLLATIFTASGQSAHSRTIRESDGTDVDHAATFLPYFDTFVADTFFATAIRQHGFDRQFGTRVLGTGEANTLITLIEGAIADSPHAALVAKIRAATD